MNAGRSALAAALSRASAEFRGNLRLRLGAWVLLGLLLFYWLLLRVDDASLAYSDYATASERLQRAQAMLTQQDWTQRLGELRSAERALQDELWRAETEAQAQAQLRTVLDDIVASGGMRELRVRSGQSQQLPEAPGIWRVQAQMTGRYTAGAELEVVHAVATHAKKLVVDRLDLTPGRNPYMMLIVSAYFVGIDAPPSAS